MKPQKTAATGELPRLEKGDGQGHNNNLRVSEAAQERAREALRNRLAEGLEYRFGEFLRGAALDEIYFLDEVLNTRESVGGDLVACFLDAVPGIAAE